MGSLQPEGKDIPWTEDKHSSSSKGGIENDSNCPSYESYHDDAQTILHHGHPHLARRDAANTPIFSTFVPLKMDYVYDEHTPILDTARAEERWNIGTPMGGGTAKKTVDNDGRTALHHAARVGHHGDVRTLIRRGADIKAVDNGGRTALHDAAYAGYQDVVRTLIREGADIEAVDNDGRTALHDAACAEKWEIVGILVFWNDGTKAGIDNEGRTVLHGAARAGYQEIVRKLIRRGADIKAVDKNGRTALHDAARAGYQDVVKTLISEGADVNAVDNNGRTALHDAAHAGHWGIVDTLVRNDTNLNSEDSDGQTPLQQLLVKPPQRTGHYINIWKVIEKNSFGSIGILVRHILLAGPHFVINHILWNWEVPDAIVSEHSSRDNVKIQQLYTENTVLVRTSSNNADSEAMERFTLVTCAQYLEESYGTEWSQLITEVLKLIILTDLHPKHFGFSICASQSPLIWITCLHDSVEVNFHNHCDIKIAFNLIEAIDWICKTVRIPSLEDNLSISSATYHLEHCTPTTKDIDDDQDTPPYILNPIINLTTSILPPSEFDCWRLLFNSCIVVDVPLSQDVSLGKGLEASFDLMVSLAAAELCLEVNGGLVFLGYETVLYPTAVQENFAQFHLIACKGGPLNPYTTPLPNRILVKDATCFKDMQCFIGWCDMAAIKLGTNHLGSTVRYSRGCTTERTLNLDGLSVVGQIGTSVPMTANFGLQTSFKYLSHRRQFTLQSSYSHLLRNTSQELAIVYDDNQCRCWLVPKLSLLLHMGRVYASRFGGQSPNVNEHADAVELVELLEPAGNILVHGTGDDAFLFRTLMLGLNTNLLSTVASLKNSSSQNLYGFEFMDVVTAPGRGSCMRVIKLSMSGKHWLHIVNAVDAVVVCSDLGDAITAVRVDRNISKCDLVPKGSDYLAATIPCLARLVEREGGELKLNGECGRFKISDSFWELSGDPFKACQHNIDGEITCWKRTDLLQRLRKKTRVRGNFSIGALKNSYVRSFPSFGAVVFGKV